MMPTNTRSPITKGNAYNASISKTSKIKNPDENIQPAKHITSTNIDSPIKNDKIPFMMFVVYEFCICSNIRTILYISKLSCAAAEVSTGSIVIVLSGTSVGFSFSVILQ